MLKAAAMILLFLAHIFTIGEQSWSRTCDYKLTLGMSKVGKDRTLQRRNYEDRVVIELESFSFVSSNGEQRSRNPDF